MPPGSVLVIVNAAGAITMVSSALAFCVGLPESATLTVIGDEPCVVGVPLTVQPVSVKPAGNAPVIEHEYGVTPPVAPISALYGTPTVPFGRVFVSDSVAGAIVIGSLSLAFCAGLPASVTFTRTVELPEVVGVPLTVQPVRLKPAGNVPVMEQLYGVVPPARGDVRAVGDAHRSVGKRTRQSERRRRDDDRLNLAHILRRRARIGNLYGDDRTTRRGRCPAHNACSQRKTRWQCARNRAGVRRCPAARGNRRAVGDTDRAVR